MGEKRHPHTTSSRFVNSTGVQSGATAAAGKGPTLGLVARRQLGAAKDRL